jgi:hypothetical protein
MMAIPAYISREELDEPPGSVLVRREQPGQRRRALEHVDDGLAHVCSYCPLVNDNVLP